MNEQTKEQTEEQTSSTGLLQAAARNPDSGLSDKDSGLGDLSLGDQDP